VIPPPRAFDILFLGQTIEHLDDPLAVLRRLVNLLAPGGVLVLSTPNLDSRQIDLFGPTWSHWHPPYHRTLFSRKSLELLGRGAGLEMARCRSHSHPYWSGLSLRLHAMGLGAAVPHGLEIPAELKPAALGLAAWSRWNWDWRGGGDYLFAVFRREHGG
jgi:SAM-dependent methyltransferase